VVLDQLPVDGLVAEQRVDVGVAGGRGRPVEDQVVPVADAGQQVEPQQRGQPEDRQRLYVDKSRGSPGSEGRLGRVDVNALDVGSCRHKSRGLAGSHAPMEVETT
jgi:hypothetical protein